MLSEDLHLSDKHLSDQEMLLAADGELSTRRAAQVHSHLAECCSPDPRQTYHDSDSFFSEE